MGSFDIFMLFGWLACSCAIAFCIRKLHLHSDRLGDLKEKQRDFLSLLDLMDKREELRHNTDRSRIGRLENQMKLEDARLEKKIEDLEKQLFHP